MGIILCQSLNKLLTGDHYVMKTSLFSKLFYCLQFLNNNNLYLVYLSICDDYPFLSLSIIIL